MALRKRVWRGIIVVFFSSLSTSSLVITGVGNGNGKWENPKDEETYMSCCCSTVLLDHVVIWSR